MTFTHDPKFWYDLVNRILPEGSDWRSIKFVLDVHEKVEMNVSRRYSTEGTGEKYRNYSGIIQEHQINTKMHLAIHCGSHFTFTANYKMVKVWRRHGRVAVPLIKSFDDHFEFRRASHLTDDDTEHVIMLALLEIA